MTKGNTLNIGIIGSGSLGSNVARALASQRAMFYAGDDAAAKAEVRKVLDAIGDFPVDLGTLAVGGRLSELPFGALSASQFIKI